MKKNGYKSSNGAISVFVLMSMLFFLFCMIGVFSIVSKKAQTQTQSIVELKDKYYEESEENQVYQNKFANDDEVIPIYTKEQLDEIGTDTEIEIDGKIYNFSMEKQYELKNNIIFDISEVSNSTYSNLNKNNFEFFYLDSTTNKFYQVASESDTAVTEERNGIKLAEKYIDQKTIMESPKIYYGCQVNYEAENKDAAKWRIFYADSDNIYLIADNYIHYSYVPRGRNGSEITINDNEYCFSMQNVTMDYSGSIDITSQNPAYNLINDYFEASYSSTSNNMKSIAYMFDTNKWSKFKGDRAEYAIGGPTLKMFLESYNNRYENELVEYYEQYLKDATGYQLKNKVQGSEPCNFKEAYLKTDNSLYVLPSEIIGKRANAMWLATPAYVDGTVSDNLMYISFNGDINSNSYDYNDIGFRPVVCLSSDVVLSRQLDGTYDVK